MHSSIPWAKQIQGIERKHLTLRIKRLAKTTVFRASEMHDTVIGFINRYEFGRAV